jgi:hypothetical protein
MEGTVLPQNISLFEEVIGNYLRGLPCNVTAVAGNFTLRTRFGWRDLF